jgi:peptidoglycan LD-endopeptidase CwlK
MSYKLSSTSKDRLSTVKPELIEIVELAITLTKVDFGVSQGIRTLEEQIALVKAGASKTTKSKHLTGDAVDLVAYIGSRVSWELNLYDDIADAMKEAAIVKGVSIRWGGAWQCNDIRKWEGTMQSCMNEYIDLRRSEGKKPFIDGPHFELI